MHRGFLALLVWVVIGSFAPIAIKEALKEMPAITVNFFRFVIAVCVVLPFFLRENRGKLGKKDILSLLAVGSLGGVFNTTLYAIGLQYTSATLAQVLYTLTPLCVAGMQYLLYREKLLFYQVVGISIGLIGVIFLYYQSLFSHDVLSIGTPLGNIIILAAVFFWSLYGIFSKHISKKYSPLTISFASFVSAVIGLFPLVVYEGYITSHNLFALSPSVYLSLFFLGTISSVVTYFLYQYGVKHTTALTASLVFYISPILVSIPAVIILHEQLTAALLVGSAITLFGVFLATMYPHIKHHSKAMLQ